MHAAATGSERERGEEGEAMRGAEGGHGRRGRSRGVEARREGWGQGWGRERARKKKRAAGGRTQKLVTLDTSHSLSGRLKEVASRKRCYAERERAERRG